MRWLRVNPCSGLGDRSQISATTPPHERARERERKRKREKKKKIAPVIQLILRMCLSCLESSKKMRFKTKSKRPRPEQRDGTENISDKEQKQKQRDTAKKEQKQKQRDTAKKEQKQ
ncbi:protein PXR1-like, partial [Penaeus japonicus]|uniref:protein PXR1-like n=1 Tax=Penaeus japonicus TaxID=27405 RepID=UPI001C71250B